MSTLANGAHEARRTSFQHLTQTSRGTPSGELLRRYWQPVALSSDVTRNGSPHALRILGENLVLYRNDRGQPGYRTPAERALSNSTTGIGDGEGSLAKAR